MTSTCLQIKIDMRRHETGTQTRGAFCRGQVLVLSPAPTLTIVTVTTISIWVRVKPESDLRPRLGSERGGRCIGDTARSCGVSRSLGVSAFLRASPVRDVTVSCCPGPRQCHQPYYCCCGQSRRPLPSCSSPLKISTIITCVISTFKNGNSSLHQWQFWQF